MSSSAPTELPGVLSGSNWSEAMISAVFVCELALRRFAVSVKVAAAVPAAVTGTLAIVHIPVFWL